MIGQMMKMVRAKMARRNGCRIEEETPIPWDFAIQNQTHGRSLVCAHSKRVKGHFFRVLLLVWTARDHPWEWSRDGISVGENSNAWYYEKICIRESLVNSAWYDADEDRAAPASIGELVAPPSQRGK